MNTRINKMTIIVLALMGFVVSMTKEAEALEPRLLWEKAVPFKISDIKMAGQSGDLIIYSRDARQIILYDKNGNKRFHWGPRIDRQPMGIDISDDGGVILFKTSFTEDYLEKKKMPGQWDRRIHYATRKGKELWNKPIFGTASLSPDGKMVLQYPSAGEGDNFLTALDLQGKILWRYPFSSSVASPVFSPDGNYIAFTGGAGLNLLDKSGNLLWKKPDAAIDWGGSISEGATYIFDDVHKKLYDKQGNVVFEGEAEVSGDGKRMMVLYQNPKRMSILNLPDKTVIKEYAFWGGFISSDGHFLITSGTNNPDNLRIIDTMGQASSEILLESNNRVRGNTKDGKYLVVVVDDKKILFYQIY